MKKAILLTITFLISYSFCAIAFASYQSGSSSTNSLGITNFDFGDGTSGSSWTDSLGITHHDFINSSDYAIPTVILPIHTGPSYTSPTVIPPIHIKPTYTPITPTQSCQNQYGIHSYGKGDDYCYCSNGYKWNIGKTACIKEIIPEPYIAPEDIPEPAWLGDPMEVNDSKNKCGIHSVSTNNGECRCEEGYLWESDDPSSLDCIPQDSWCKKTYGDKSQYNFKLDRCICIKGYEFDSGGNKCIKTIIESNETGNQTKNTNTKTEDIFSDISRSHSSNKAISYLLNRGIVKGYKDGTFKPSNTINRAEFIKIVMGATSKMISGSNCFNDIGGEWFASYVCTAKREGIINGYPDNTFRPGNPINVVEALKITLNAFDVSTRQASQDEFWYTPFTEHAKKNGIYLDTFNDVGKQVAREEMAETIYRLIMVQEGGEVQTLLSQAEADLVQALQDIQKGDVSHAESMVGKAVDITNQVLLKRPDEKVVKAAVKIAESFQKLVETYKLGQEGKGNDAVLKADECKNTATAAITEDNSVQPIANKIQALAQSVIDQILNSN